MPYYADRKLISWLAPKDVHDMVTKVARIEDRTVSNYLRRLILQDLRARGVVTDDGQMLPEEELVGVNSGDM